MDVETDLVNELERFRKRCIELEEKNKIDETRCLMLENEIEYLKKRNEELEGKIVRIQNVVNDGNGEQDDDDSFVQLMIENKVLECEKRKAETDLCSSKEKVKKLEARVTKIVTIDDEDADASYDDNTPICTLIKTRHSSRLRADSEGAVKEESSKKRLTRLRKLESENIQDKSGFDLNETVCLHGNVSSEEESESEEESLGGFIVKSSENESVSDCASGSDDSFDQSEDGLDNYKVTLEKIGRKKGSNLKWDLEGDMLADFGKDPELCMRAVCVLYRQQTADEKASKGTFHHNARGFSQTDAFRASKLAEFLTDGDSVGDLNKTVEQLRRYDSKGIKLCMELAAKYSKQLFQIYQNKDPYFMPQ